ncbi:MAG: tetratricopeptide repeat protein [Bdellovibrionales bacterium]|nr:tetratricopeptide repeat protein [Bdellovibrionales bacterium]
MRRSALSLLTPLLLCSSCVDYRALSPEQAALREEHLQSLLNQSIEYMEQGSDDTLENANNALELARDLDPNDPRVLDALGCVEWRRGNYKLAAYFFEKALAADSGYDRAYVHLALNEERLGRIDSAEELLRIAIQLNPMNFRARNNYAALLLDKGFPHEARKQLQRAAHSAGREDAIMEINLRQTSPSY